MNPFDEHSDPERHKLWQRLVAVDCAAFAVGNWSAVEDDFDAESFEGIRCFHSTNPDDWKIAFPDLASYRDSWLQASEQFRAKQFAEVSHLEALLARTHVDDIQINGDRALALKKFYGEVRLAAGTFLADRRQTLFRLRHRHDGWKIVGFLGQLQLIEPHKT